MSINAWWLVLAWFMGVAWGYYMKGLADKQYKNKIEQILNFEDKK